MYLAELTNEEKQVFLQLAYAIAKTDGNYAEEEQAMMSVYSKECGITFEEPDSLKDIQELLASLKESSKKAKRIILLELIAMALVDTNYEDKEKSLIEEIANGLEIENADVEEAVRLCDDYLSVGRALNNFIKKGE